MSVQPAPSPSDPHPDPSQHWRHRLDQIVSMVREMSLQTDPGKMVRAYIRRIRGLDAHRTLRSRSAAETSSPPATASPAPASGTMTINPWKQKDKLPLLEGGLIAEIIYGEEPLIIDDLQVDPTTRRLSTLQGMRP